MTTATVNRYRKFVLPLPEVPRRLVAHMYKEDGQALNVWFSVKDEHNEDPSDVSDEEDGLVTGFEAVPEDGTVIELKESVRDGPERQEEAVTKAFFDTVRKASGPRAQLLRNYPRWTQELLDYLKEHSDEVRTQFYFQLESRLRS